MDPLRQHCYSSLYSRCEINIAFEIPQRTEVYYVKKSSTTKLFRYREVQEFKGWTVNKSTKTIHSFVCSPKNLLVLPIAVSSKIKEEKAAKKFAQKQHKLRVWKPPFLHVFTSRGPDRLRFGSVLQDHRLGPSTCEKLYLWGTKGAEGVEGCHRFCFSLVVWLKEGCGNESEDGMVLLKMVIYNFLNYFLGEGSFENKVLSMHGISLACKRRYPHWVWRLSMKFFMHPFTITRMM